MIDYGDFTLKFDTEGITGLYEWIDANFKCIKKGTQPHPYADVLHEWAEDTTLTVEAKEYGGAWCKSVVNNVSLNAKEYRIKPQEPVYEWQWYYIDNGVAYLSESFLTIDEALDKWDYKIKETKRERK